MERKIIHLKKHTLYVNLFLGLMWLTIGILHFSFNDVPQWFGYGYFIVGSFEIGLFIYNYKHQYLIIEGDVLIKNKVYGLKNKCSLNDINEIENHSSGNYILKSEGNRFKIDPIIIEEESLKQLTEIFKQLDIPEDKNYFSKFKNTV